MDVHVTTRNGFCGQAFHLFAQISLCYACLDVSRYEGSYFNGLRQGTGVYKFSPKGNMAGALYMGQWLRGRMYGLGMLVYADGEWYMGAWQNDVKHGLGVRRVCLSVCLSVARTCVVSLMLASIIACRYVHSM